MTILTIGSFDLFHIGHLNLLERCAELGDNVIVGINSDSFIESYKGKAPIMSQTDRADFIARLGYKTEINDGPGKELVESTLPKFLVVGSDWARKDYLKQIDVTQDWLDKNDISVVYVPYTAGISTTEIKRRINEN